MFGFVCFFIVPVIGSLAGFTGAVMGALKTQLVAPTEFGMFLYCVILPTGR